MQTPIKRVKEILALRYAAADFGRLSLPESDSEAWLYDGEHELTSAMQERQAEIDAHESKRSAAKTTADEPLYDPEELVQGIQAFMSKISSYEGAELPGGENKSSNSLY